MMIFSPVVTCVVLLAVCMCAVIRIDQVILLWGCCGGSRWWSCVVLFCVNCVQFVKYRVMYFFIYVYL